jgi:hypothetical protein
LPSFVSLFLYSKLNILIKYRINKSLMAVHFIYLTTTWCFYFVQKRNYFPLLFYRFSSVISRVDTCDPMSRFNPTRFIHVPVPNHFGVQYFRIFQWSDSYCCGLQTSIILSFQCSLPLTLISNMKFTFFKSKIVKILTKQDCFVHYFKNIWHIAKSIISDLPWFVGGRRGHSRMVDGLTMDFTTNVLSSNTAHAQVYSIHYVIKFVSDSQIGVFLGYSGFLHQ